MTAHIRCEDNESVVVESCRLQQTGEVPDSLVHGRYQSLEKGKHPLNGNNHTRGQNWKRQFTSYQDMAVSLRPRQDTGPGTSEAPAQDRNIESSHEQI
jgi:hypothetical protein